MGNTIKLKHLVPALEEIKRHADLEQFRLKEGDKFCKKYNLQTGQLNFLISSVAAERFKNRNLLQKPKYIRIPKTTKEKPYIEFTFAPTGKLKLCITSSWWGGKNGGFIRNSDIVGNSCLPEALPFHLKAFKKRQIAKAEKEIARLMKRIEALNRIPEL